MSKNNVEVDVDFTDTEFLVLARIAHERDITINELVALALTEFLENRIEEKEDGKSND